jgi:phosphoribosylformylglycinamidine synthase subunit PurL
VDEDRPLGIEVELDDELPLAALLYGEAQSRVVVSCLSVDLERVLQHFAGMGVPARHIGRVAEVGGAFRITTQDAVLEAPIGELATIFYSAIPRRMDGTPAEVDAALSSEVRNP